jgi:inosine-uridine nucleoside N-ribohydrolase
MRRPGWYLLAAVLATSLLPSPALAQKQKVIVDQDARGPASTDMQSILMFLQSPDIDVLGITLVAGDQWVKEQTQRTLRAVEIAGRTDVPVVPGAEHPLINSKEESEMWEKRYGELSFKGAWTPRFYHPPDLVPDLVEGKPSTRPSNEHAVDFIVRMVHQYPGQVTLWAGGPLTNIALALRMDPEVATLAKELVLMGAGFNVDKGGIHRINGRREFNWWFDPEAVHIVMRAPWKKITITPVDISVKTTLDDRIKGAIAKADTPLAKYLTQFSRGSYMWDEISAAAILDPSIITRQQELYVDIDIDHGGGYGQTIFVEKEVKVPPGWPLSTVQFDLNLEKFYRLYIDLMTRPAPKVEMSSGRSMPPVSTMPARAPSPGRQLVFIDQDARGATGTDMQSMLMLLQSPKIEVAGISITSGDGWVREGVQNTLRMLELTGHGDVPVAQGAEFPLINSRQETNLWEAQFGVFAYKGAWNERNYHEANVVPPLATGNPAKKVIDKHGARFLIETLRAHPGEVVLWCGGPLTTVALAIALDPEVPTLAKELVLMGGGFNVDKGGNHHINGRREFNWWFDPEATRMVMSAPWKKITITPVDISVKTSATEELKASVTRSNSTVAQYLSKYAPRGGGGGGGGYMWDEIAAGALIDPSLITKQQELFVNVDINHGASYGQTIFVEKEVKVPSWWKLATVQWDLDTKRFYQLYTELMSR